jgi:hypothetical protein
LSFTRDDTMELVHLDGNRRDFSMANVSLVHQRCVAVMKSKHAAVLHHIVEEPDDGKLSRPVLKTSASGDTRA